MTSVILFTYIFLFAAGCIGTASMIFLHICLKMKLTRYFSILFSILLFSLSRILLSVYFSDIKSVLSILEFLNIILGIALSLTLYILIYFILIELKDSSKMTAVLSSIFIITVQIGRTVLFYKGKNEFLYYLHPAFVCIISAYLFFVGLLLYRGIEAYWNPAVQRMIRSTGLVTLVFAPVSAVIYVFLHMMKIQNQISLDFIFMALWGIVTARVLLHYLARIGTVPVSDAADDAFFLRYRISQREKEVLALILEGYTNKEIGEKLFISFTTARTHVSHIFEKTDVKSRIELVAKVLAEKM